MRLPREIRIVAIVAAIAAASNSACNSDSITGDAGFSNVVDTVTLYALRGTDVALPSGYDVPNRSIARTDVAEFDFAFDINEGGQSVVLPAGALHLRREAGISKTTIAFDSIIEAPETGYVDSLPVSVSVGSVFVVRSRFFLTNCQLAGSVPRYGKFRVMEVDPAIRRLKLEALVDQNCGYRGLQPGFPPN